MTKESLWNRAKTYTYYDRGLGFAIDISRMNFSNNYFASMKDSTKSALEAMQSLESGEIVNPDEKRMVGHYWLRDSALAPQADITKEIDSTLARIKDFAAEVHSGKIAPGGASRYESLLLIGIGGSALGPKFVSEALLRPKDPLRVYFFDNTDPNGMKKTLNSIPDLSKTLAIVISKSGGTPETRNGQIVAAAAWESAGLSFASNAVAITCEGSALDNKAVSENWLARFPMWDWVGGRTSELSAVGLLAAALQGIDVDAMLKGAKDMDKLTRNSDCMQNPAALLALMWYWAGDGKGSKDMVLLPYNDRLELFSRYLQQLVMESLGKREDLNGNIVNQGLAVYGNKGSTDQHAYVQQLRDGLNNFFVTFIEVLDDCCGTDKESKCKCDSSKEFCPAKVEVEPEILAGDYLSGFYQGTRSALFEEDRESISITINNVNEHSIGMLIALFERAVGLYASLVNINAYHQPGVEAGKKAAAAVLDIQKQVLSYLSANTGFVSAEEIAEALGLKDEVETVFKVLRHLSANDRIQCEAADSVFEDKYSIS